MDINKKYKYLFDIAKPSDLRSLPKSDLQNICDEIREFLIESVASTGGHLSSNLGTVELTVALHYIFDTPYDRLVWDVGHQTYVHKILTGRREQMNSLRKTGGLAGFPRREESEYDSFGTAHSSTSISAALGMAIASQKTGNKERRVVAVIGDGAMTAGLAFEGLNNAGASDANLLVVLNDNEMSISENVGALNSYLARILSGGVYSAARKASGKVLQKVPSMYELARRAEEHVKGMVMPGTLFEEFGFNYIGPIDGHDVRGLIHTLTNLKKLGGPQFLHVITRKGKGYHLAEENPIKYHGVSKFNPEEGIVAVQKKKNTYSDIFGNWLCDMAEKDSKLVAITPAMREGSGLVRFSQEYPERYFDVGIAEQHAITFAAGLACDGMRPVVAIYSTFLQRGYDQLIHDVCIQKLPVTFAIDRGGIVGADGPTHHGVFDFSFLRCIPDIIIMAPSDGQEAVDMLYTAYSSGRPAAVRYPRGSSPEIKEKRGMSLISIGKGLRVKEGKDVAILSFGATLENSLKAAQNLDCTVVDMRFVKPIDEALIYDLASQHDMFVTIEENVIMGGAGSAVGEVLVRKKIMIPLLQLGITDNFIEHGSPETLVEQCGLTPDGIVQSILSFKHNF